jgi:hypothetical protein
VEPTGRTCFSCSTRSSLAWNQKAEYAAAGRGDGIGDRAVRGEDHHRQYRIALVYGPEQCHPVHAQIPDDQLRAGARQDC